MTTLAIVFTALLLASAPALADASDSQSCSEELVELTKDLLRIHREAGVRASACALWGDKAVVAISLSPPSISRDPSDLELHVAVVNVRTRAHVASYLGKLPDGGGEEVREDSIRFDARPFDLGPGVTGFLMKVVQYSTVRCGEGGSDGQVSLFALKGRRLAPLFPEPLTTHYYRYVGGLPCRGEPYATDEIMLSLAVAGTRTNGLADLLVTRTETGAETKVFRLRYDGKSYPARVPGGGY